MSTEVTQEQINKIFTPAFGAAMGQAIAKELSPILDGFAQNPITKASTATGSTHNLIHGTGSMFGQAQVGIEPEVISAMMHWMGLGDHIPNEATRLREILMPFITGVEPTSTTEPTTECDNCISGETEACIQHFPMGRVCRETQTMTPERIIERLNHGDIDLTLLNAQLGSNSPWHPGGSFTALGQEGLMQVATAWALLFELPPLFMAALSPMVYTGNPVNNQGDGYREFRGLELLVNTGFVDAIANVTCPALDSDLKDFGHANAATQQTPSFMEVLEMAHFYVRHNARRQRLAPVRYAVVMRPELWQYISGIIPVQRTNAALLAAVNNLPNQFEVMFSGSEINAERDDYRNRMIMPLNGEIVQVITDDGITELNNATNANYAAGEYGSDVYILPLNYLGNRPGLKVQYKDYRWIAPEVRATDDLIGGLYNWSPDGRFSWTWVKDGPCFKLRATIEPRLYLRTPQLCARIQNVKYVPHQHLRSPDPDSSYFFKGGVSTRAPTSYYY
jgi:hypothetical protein